MHSPAQILIDALAVETARVAGKPTAPISVAFDFLPAQAEGTLTPRVEITRTTRTLVFATADLVNEAGARALTATSVHKILDA